MSRAFSTSYESLPKFSRTPETVKLPTSAADYNIKPSSVSNIDEFGEFEDNKIFFPITSKGIQEEISSHQRSTIKKIIREDNTNNDVEGKVENTALTSYNRDVSEYRQKPMRRDDGIVEDAQNTKLRNASKEKPIPMPRSTRAFPVSKVASLSSMNPHQDGGISEVVLHKRVNNSSSNTLHEIETKKDDLIGGTTVRSHVTRNGHIFDGNLR